MTEFLHGVETFRYTKGPRPIQQVRSAVIGLVGTAPIHHLDDTQSGLVLNETDAGKWGDELDGYTIPQGLRTIHDQGAGMVCVVNLFDPAVHYTDVAAGEIAVANKKAQLSADLISVVVKASGGAGAAKVEGTDYSLNRITGVLTVLPGGSIYAATALNISQRVADPSAVEVEDIIGDDTSGERTGLYALKDFQSTFGVKPKILIAPGYSSDPEVQAVLQVLCATFKAIAYIEYPTGYNRDAAIEGRQTGEDFAMADEGIVYCYPHWKRGDDNVSPSAVAAGVTAYTDAQFGYWFSPSNQPVKGVTGIELPLSASINDPNCDVNALNAAGIVTAFTGNNQPPTLWGNRNSLFPGSVAIESFISVKRTIDMVEESIELAQKVHVDKPIGSVLVEAILADVNAFLRLLVSRGALYAGSKIYALEEDNPPNELALGHVTLTREYACPPPMERLTNKSVFNLNLIRIT